MGKQNILLAILHTWSGTAFHESHEHDQPYRRIPGIRKPLRIVLLLAFCAAFVAWVVYDAAAADQGFSNGVRDSAYVDSTADTQEALDSMAKGSTCFCPCQFTDASSQPYIQWRWNNTKLSLLDWAWVCPDDLLPKQGTKGFDYVWRYMNAVVLSPLRISPTPFLLTEKAWSASKFQAFVDQAGVVQSVLQLELTGTIFDVLAAGNATAYQEAQAQATRIHENLLTARASLGAVYAAALDMASTFQDVIIVNPLDPAAAPRMVRCDVSKDIQALVPKLLVDVCQDDAIQARDCGNASAAYDAYKQWCVPGLCSCIKPRKPYQKFVQVAAVLGGVYSSCAVTMYMVWLVARLCMDQDALWGGGTTDGGQHGGGGGGGGDHVAGPAKGPPASRAAAPTHPDCADDVTLHGDPIGASLYEPTRGS